MTNTPDIQAIRQALRPKMTEAEWEYVEEHYVEWLRYLLEVVDLQAQNAKTAQGQFRRFRAQLDAKDTEIAAKDAQIAERDATIARQAEDNKAMKECMQDLAVHAVMDPEHRIRIANVILSLKEPK